MKFTTRTLPKNLPLLLKTRAKEVPDVILQYSKNSEGKFQEYSYAEVYSKVIDYALALKSIGIQKGDNVAFISDNRREWLISDFAILSLGAADVPRGCDSMGTEIRFITSFADCKYGIFENGRQIKKILEKVEEVPLLKNVILFDKAEEVVEKAIKDAGITLYYFDQLLEKGHEILNTDVAGKTKEIEDSMDSIKGDDIATMIFTSGTTGTPKGVMLTHGNYMSQLSVIHNFVPCKVGDIWMSILPVWHSFERLIQYLAPTMSCGLAYSKPVAPVLLPDMAVIRPQWICGVPRLWEGLANGVNRAMRKTGGITLKLFNFFISVGAKYAKMKDLVYGNATQIKKRCRPLDFCIGLIPWLVLWPWHKLGDILVFRKIRAKFGGRISIAVSGGGALQKATDDFYRAIGLNLLEGYGMSETAPVISFRDWTHPRPGVVGILFPTMDLRIVAEEHGVIKSMDPLPPGKQGLIILRSPQVMKGYYKRPDLTEKVIDKDGWFNTGDLGLMTYDGEIKITGRAKDTIVLLGGENIEPSVIEAELLGSEFIESVMVTGQDKKYLGALIVPNEDAVKAYAEQNNLAYMDYPSLLKTPEIDSLFASILNEKISTNNGFRICERIYKFVLVPKSFEVGVELSAKQEMMRYKIEELYKEQIAGLFE